VPDRWALWFCQQIRYAQIFDDVLTRLSLIYLKCRAIFSLEKNSMAQHRDVMNIRRVETLPASRPLEALGISEMEEHIYRMLLTHRMATAQDIADIFSLPLHKAQHFLDSIGSKGLATCSTDSPPRYIASSPALAIEALASQRQAAIERARLTISELKQHVTCTMESGGREEIVELITSPDVLRQTLVQIHQTVQKEICAFQRTPRFTPHATEEDLCTGVRVRSISDAAYIELPGALDDLRGVIQRGEEARFFRTLPVKMIIADRKVGLMPSNTGDSTSPILLIRGTALLDAMYALFELIWERATPIMLTRTGELKFGKPALRLSEGAEQVMQLLSAGLNDKAITHEVKMSAATLNRRVAELMKFFGARTRFQLGWRAALEVYSNQKMDATLSSD
jgi:sugar-specific transcriptional regulator TrmB